MLGACMLCTSQTQAKQRKQMLLIAVRPAQPRQPGAYGHQVANAQKCETLSEATVLQQQGGDEGPPIQQPTQPLASHLHPHTEPPAVDREAARHIIQAPPREEHRQVCGGEHVGQVEEVQAVRQGLLVRVGLRNGVGERERAARHAGVHGRVQRGADGEDEAHHLRCTRVWDEIGHAFIERLRAGFTANVRHGSALWLQPLS